MTNSKRDKSKERSPEEEQSGHSRPTHFKWTEEYRRSLLELSVTVRTKLAVQGQAFKRDCLRPDITDEDLNRRWDYKSIKGAPKGLNVKQVRPLKDYRIAMLIGKRYVWLLRAYLRQTNNNRDYKRAIEAAQKIKERDE
jgi:hypothetical protein